MLCLRSNIVSPNFSCINDNVIAVGRPNGVCEFRDLLCHGNLIATSDVGDSLCSYDGIVLCSTYCCLYDSKHGVIFCFDIYNTFKRSYYTHPVKSYGACLSNMMASRSSDCSFFFSIENKVYILAPSRESDKWQCSCMLAYQDPNKYAAISFICAHPTLPLLVIGTCVKASDGGDVSSSKVQGFDYSVLLAISSTESSMNDDQSNSTGAGEVSKKVQLSQLSKMVRVFSLIPPHSEGGHIMFPQNMVLDAVGDIATVNWRIGADGQPVINFYNISNLGQFTVAATADKSSQSEVHDDISQRRPTDSPTGHNFASIGTFGSNSSWRPTCAMIIHPTEPFLFVICSLGSSASSQFAICCYSFLACSRSIVDYQYLSFVDDMITSTGKTPLLDLQCCSNGILSICCQGEFGQSVRSFSLSTGWLQTHSMGSQPLCLNLVSNAPDSFVDGDTPTPRFLMLNQSFSFFSKTLSMRYNYKLSLATCTAPSSHGKAVSSGVPLSSEQQYDDIGDIPFLVAAPTPPLNGRFPESDTMVSEGFFVPRHFESLLECDVEAKWFALVGVTLTMNSNDEGEDARLMTDLCTIPTVCVFSASLKPPEQDSVVCDSLNYRDVSFCLSKNVGVVDKSTCCLVALGPDGTTMKIMSTPDPEKADSYEAKCFTILSDILLPIPVKRIWTGPSLLSSASRIAYYSQTSRKCVGASVDLFDNKTVNDEQTNDLVNLVPMLFLRDDCIDKQDNHRSVRASKFLKLKFSSKSTKKLKREVLTSCRSTLDHIKNHLDDPTRSEFYFNPDEEVVELLWQPLPSSLRCTSKEKDKKEVKQQLSDTDVWMCGNGNESSEIINIVTLMVAIRTTQRVLVLNAVSLEVISSLAFCGGISVLYDNVSSISWLAMSVVCMFESGAVRYLIPYEDVVADQPLSDNGYLNTHRLCTIPTSINASGQGRILSVLPDRMLLLYPCPDSTSLNRNNYCTTARHTSSVYPLEKREHRKFIVFSRPCIPVECLMLSLLKRHGHRSFSKDNTDQDRSKLLIKTLLSLIVVYFPMIAIGGGDSSISGSFPYSHYSSLLCQTLMDAGLSKLASLICHITSDVKEYTRYSNSCNFRLMKWLSPLQRRDVALSAKYFDIACFEILSSRPDLQELFLDPEGYGGGSLLHPHSPLAVQYLHTARSLVQHEEWAQAAKMADLAGNDAYLTNVMMQLVLSKPSLSQNTLSSFALQFMTQLMGAVQKVNPPLHMFLYHVTDNIKSCDAKVDGNGAEDIDTDTLADILEHCFDDVAVTGLGSSASRRNYMLPVTYDSIVKQETVVKMGTTVTDDMVVEDILNNGGKNTAYLTYVAGKRESSFRGRGGGVGPRTTLGSLAMDSVEDWLGVKTQLELAVPEESSGNGPRFGGFRATASVATPPTTMSAESLSLMKNWTANVGQGKEADQLVGYWRFSDIILPPSNKLHDPELELQQPYFSSGEVESKLSPHCLANVLDLSKYAIPLEIVAKSGDGIELLDTLSPVDPGEDHEKVKSLYDVSFSLPKDEENNGSDDRLHFGLRANVSRGCPLDVGMYHHDTDNENRNQLTLEMWVCHTMSNEKEETETLLACRTLKVPDPEIRDHNATLWAVTVNDKGIVNVHIGGPTLLTGFPRAKSPPVVCSNTSVFGTSDGKWTHVAVVFNSSAGNALESRVSLYLDAASEGEASFTLPSHSEEELSRSSILFCPQFAHNAPKNVVSWKFTEIRLWSTSRSASDLEAQKDNFLPLASKRKRQLLRIAGNNKRLFCALGKVTLDGCLPVESMIMAVASDASDTSVPSTDTKKSTAPLLPSKPLKPGFPAIGTGSKLGGPSKLAPLPSGGGSVAARRRASMAAPPKSKDKPAFGALAPPKPKLSLGSVADVEDDSTTESASEAPALTLSPVGHVPLTESTACVLTCSDVFRCIRTPSFVMSSPLTSGDAHRKDAPHYICANKRGTEHSIILMPSTNGPEGGDKSDEHRCYDVANCDSVLFIPNQSYSEGHVDAVGCVVDVMAIFANKKLFIDQWVTTSSDGRVERKRQSLVEQAMGAPLIFWQQMGGGECGISLMLVTSNSLFSWVVSVKKSPDMVNTRATAAVPKKLADRVDISDPSRWSERRVMAMHTSEGGAWVVLVTCRRVATGTGGHEELVSLHHISTGQSLLFKAVNAIISPDGKYVILCFASLIASDSLHLVCIDLSKAVPTEKPSSVTAIQMEDVVKSINNDDSVGMYAWIHALSIVGSTPSSLPNRTVFGGIQAVVYMFWKAGDEICTLHAATGTVYCCTVLADYAGVTQLSQKLILPPMAGTVLALSTSVSSDNGLSVWVLATGGAKRGTGGCCVFELDV